MPGRGVTVALVVVGTVALAAAGAVFGIHQWLGSHRVVPFLASEMGYTVREDGMHSSGLWHHAGPLTIVDQEGNVNLALKECEESLAVDLPAGRLVRHLRLVTEGGMKLDVRAETPLFSPASLKRLTGDVAYAHPMALAEVPDTMAFLVPLTRGATHAGELEFEVSEFKSVSTIRGHIAAKGKFDSGALPFGFHLQAVYDTRIVLADGHATVERANLSSSLFDMSASGGAALGSPFSGSALDIVITASAKSAMAMVASALGLPSNTVQAAVVGPLRALRFVSTANAALMQTPEYEFIDSTQSDCYTPAFLTSDLARTKAAASQATLARLACDAGTTAPGFIAFELENAEGGGARVTRVAEDDLLGQIGVHAGDVLKSVAGAPIDADSRFQIVRDIGSAEREVLIEVVRDEQPLRLLVVRIKAL